MSDDSNAILERYLNRLFALRDTKTRPLQQDDFQAIALDLGLSDADLAAARDLAQTHQVRAQGYLNHQRWDDALAELEPAAVLHPFALETLHLQARAYAGRWQQRGQASDREQAIALAKRCLDQQADFQPAFQLLNDLDRPPTGRLARAPRGTLLAIATSAVAGLALVATATSIFLIQRAPQPEQTATTTTTATPAESAAPPRSPQHPTRSETSIPVEFVPPADAPDLTLATERSRLQIFNDSAYHQLQGYLVNTSDRELHHLQVQVELLGADGAAIATSDRYLLSQSDSELRPGDRQAFGWTQDSEADLAAVRVTAIASETTPAAPSYEPSQPVPLAWANSPASEVQLTVRERQARQPQYDETIHHIAQFEIANTGEVAFELLRLRIDYLDAAGEVVASREPFLVTSSEPPLLPGETRLLRTTQTELPLDFEGYELTATDWD